MNKKWLWGPWAVDSEYKGLRKLEYLRKLADVREKYLNKLLVNLNEEDIPFICRLEKARFLILAEWDKLSEEAFNFRFDNNTKEIENSLKEIACDFLHNPEADTSGWFAQDCMSDITAHLITHEEKNIDPNVNETLEHMAEHEEAHLLQIKVYIENYKFNIHR